jgi:hypothetical protein
MTHRTFSKKIAYFMITLLAIVIFLPVCTQAQIGANGGKTTLKSDIEMMSGIPVHGGGHFTWVVTGPAAGELRQAIIRDYDIPHGTSPRNWQLEIDEVEQYALDLERYLEQGEHEYMGANLRKFALLNYDVRDDTKGLIGASNATPGDIEIRFYFDAWMPSGNEEMELTDPVIPSAIYFPVNESYLGTYTIEHTTYMVSVGDFSDIRINKGTFYLIRTPFGEIYYYSVTFTESDNPNEKILYEPFNWIEAPLVLFIVMVVFGYFVVTMPGRFRRYDVLKVVKLHTLMKVLLLILILIYLFAAFGGAFISGIYVWIICVVFLFVSLVVSKTVYENAKRIATMPEKPETGAAPGEELEDEIGEPMGRNVQCTTCGEIYPADDRYHVGSSPCPACGNIGAVELGGEETQSPPPDLEPPPADYDNPPPPPPPPEEQI